MIYHNPIISGFYPDPSICAANGKFYLVTSSFQYFPGVPLFESTDLVNWTQIGHVLTRESQVMLDRVRASGGVFAPTIRYDNGRFYMITNNNSTNENFYVYTDDIYGEWSDPITIDMNGIDPSLLFDDGHVYALTNGQDDEGNWGIVQCEIDIETGARIGACKCLWKGSGGRYIESPHMYRIGSYYYLMIAEGGTEYGHMVTYTRSDSPWGPFADYDKNPVLTNRNKAPNEIQGIGHGDLIQNRDGSWYMVTLGFRQIGTWEPYHNLGREVYLTPVWFDADGWFTCGKDGTTEPSYEIPGDYKQECKTEYTFRNTDWNIDWAYLRKYHPENYHLSDQAAMLRGTDLTLDDVDSPTFIALRQKDFCMEVSSRILLEEELTKDAESHPRPGSKHLSAGLTVYMCEDEHYDVELVKTEAGILAQLKLNIGGIKHVQALHFPPKDDATKGTSGMQAATLMIRADHDKYDFYVQFSADPEPVYLGSGRTKYLSSEVSGGFTGTMVGMYATGHCTAAFTDFVCRYPEEQ
ncbi:MAG: glycoside hydrolase family 43 protein [Eubacterium sp.]|nr:glycoside hydrolase family 43 protein [Eubacterium sp.]